MDKKELESLIKTKNKEIELLKKMLAHSKETVKFLLKISDVDRFLRPMRLKGIDYPKYADDLDLYKDLFANGFIRCKYRVFSCPRLNNIEWLGTWKELSCLTEILLNDNKYATLAYFFYKITDNQIQEYELLHGPTMRSTQRGWKFISGKDLKSYSEKTGDTTVIDSVIIKYKVFS